MTKRVSLPGTLLSLGFLSVAIYSAGCGSDSSGGAGGAGAKGGSAAGGAGAKGGSAGGGKGGGAVGGAAGGASGGAAGGANGGAAGGAAGGANGGAAGGANGGAAGGAKGGAAGGANGGAAGGAKGGAGGANGGAAGGAKGGAGGANGGAAGGKGGAAGGAGGAGGSTLAATLCPSTGGMYTGTSTAKMSPSEFCDLFLMTCGSAVAGHTTKAECMATYGSTQNMTVAAGSTNGTIGACESYHLCNAVSAPAGHCPHAAGTAICVAPTP